MSTIGPQRWVSVLSNSGSIANNGSITGSAFCRGYTALVGGVSMGGSTAANGLKIEWSFNNGSSFDYVSASNGLADGASAACAINPIFADAVKITVTAGATGASRAAVSFWLRPV